MFKLKYLLIVIFILSLGKKAFSQDIIFFKDGTKDSVKVIEIGTELIVYKKYTRLNGATYKVEKTKVILIEFEDGTVEVVNTKSSQEDRDNYPALYKPNILTINAFGLFITNFHFGYESILDNGKFGIKVNLAVSPLLLAEEGFALVGTDFNFYPSGQKPLSFFYGPSLRLGYFAESVLAATLFHVGGAYSARSSFYLSSSVGVGPGYFDDDLIPYGFWQLNLGKRF